MPWNRGDRECIGLGPDPGRPRYDRRLSAKAKLLYGRSRPPPAGRVLPRPQRLFLRPPGIERPDRHPAAGRELVREGYLRLEVRRGRTGRCWAADLPGRAGEERYPPLTEMTGPLLTKLTDPSRTKWRRE